MTARELWVSLGKWCPGAESNHRHEDFQFPFRQVSAVPNGAEVFEKTDNEMAIRIKASPDSFGTNPVHSDKNYTEITRTFLPSLLV